MMSVGLGIRKQIEIFSIKLILKKEKFGQKSLKNRGEFSLSA